MALENNPPKKAIAHSGELKPIMFIEVNSLNWCAIILAANFLHSMKYYPNVRVCHFPFLFTERAARSRKISLALLNSSIKVVGSKEATPSADFLMGSSTEKSSVQEICLSGYCGSLGLFSIASSPSLEIEKVSPGLAFRILLIMKYLQVNTICKQMTSIIFNINNRLRSLGSGKVVDTLNIKVYIVSQRKKIVPSNATSFNYH